MFVSVGFSQEAKCYLLGSITVMAYGILAMWNNCIIMLNKRTLSGPHSLDGNDATEPKKNTSS